MGPEEAPGRDPRLAGSPVCPPPKGNRIARVLLARPRGEEAMPRCRRAQTLPGHRRAPAALPLGEGHSPGDLHPLQRFDTATAPKLPRTPDPQHCPCSLISPPPQPLPSSPSPSPSSLPLAAPLRRSQHLSASGGSPQTLLLPAPAIKHRFRPLLERTASGRQQAGEDQACN